MDTDSLFPQAIEPPVSARGGAAPAGDGPFAAVAIEQSIDRMLDYSIPPRFRTAIRVGQRVRVPLGRGNKPVFGYVVKIHPTTEYPKIKPISQIDDERVLIDAKLMLLAQWIARYYCTPLGAVIDSIIPRAVKSRVGIGYVHVVKLEKSREEVQAMIEKTRAPKRRQILAHLLQLGDSETILLPRLASEAGVTVPTVRKLAMAGVISIAAMPQMPEISFDDAGATQQDLPFTPDQQRVYDELLPRVAAGFSVNLVHGVTGSGKTEIYLQCIRRAVEAGKQAIVLVPEIALTPQTVRRFTARFPRVAVVHSGMSAGQRHRYWHQISSGWAQVVVGARSAIFAPVPNLGIIVVDEEHESSYKQDSAPRYHARDVAIKRAQLESACAILGSATPAMETYHRVRSRADALAETGAGARREVPYALLRLPVRVHGGAMPKVEVIDMKEEARQRRGVHLISRRLEHSLHECLQQKHQSIVLLNRRGYSNFIHCASCDNLITCKYCDKTMTYHRSQEMHTQSASIEKSIHTGLLHCHYCLAVQTLPAACPACGKKLSLFGLGTQRVEEELQRLMPNLRFARVDSDSMRSSKDYATVLDRFGRGEIDCLLGTQMIAKGLDFPNVTLVGVISGDTALALPDFRAAERTFQLITQVSGRAGRGSALGRVVLQTFLPDDPTIQFAIKQDYEGFAEEELSQRKQVGLPPFARMVRIVMRDQDEQKLQRLAAELATRLVNAAVPDGHRVRVKGPMPCAIGRISGYWRQQIVLSSPDPARLQRILAAVREKGGLTKSDRVAVDVDPVSLL